MRAKAPKGRDVHSLEGLDFDDPAPNPDHGGVGAIVSAQFGEDVLHAAFDGFLAERELSSDLLVGISIGNQTQDVVFFRGLKVAPGASIPTPSPPPMPAVSRPESMKPIGTNSAESWIHPKPSDR